MVPVDGAFSNFLSEFPWEERKAEAAAVALMTHKVGPWRLRANFELLGQH